MKLLPIQPTLEQNQQFADDPFCRENLQMSVEYYKTIGFNPPWICYYAEKNGQLVGNAAFKGQPVNGRVEIAYGTFQNFRNRGIGKEICKTLVDLSLQTDPSVRVTARTLPEKNHSTRILQANSFKYMGVVNDPDDGDVWEWEYQPGEKA